MQIFMQFVVDVCAPMIAGTVVLCVIDWVVVMFKRALS